ncbi:hypothetical protein MKX03_000047, partial [Papaver bracteatum]
SLGVALPDLKFFTEASIAATRIFKRIYRVPIIYGEDTKGLVLDQVHGEIEFEHVKFTYLSRPDSIVLRDLNLNDQAGHTVALVGASGCGNCNRIVIMSEVADFLYAIFLPHNCIIENGSHNDLISNKNGHYAKLAKLQRKFSVDDHDMVASDFRYSITRSSSCFASPLSFDNTSITPSYPPPSFRRLLSMNSTEWKQGLVGSLSAVVFGAVQPVYALTIGARICTYTLILSSLTVVSIIVNLIKHYNFAYMGERLTRRIRLRMLEKILTFEDAWFDQEENSSGNFIL